MYISTLNLADFRNYEKLEFHPSNGLNILVGLNAQGKSAVLEAIYLLATSKSHRTSRDMDMIRIGENITRVFAEVVRSERNDTTLEIILSRTEKKTVKINSVKHEKIGDIVGQLNTVIFSNADIDMVRGEPSKRRRFLNLEVSQVSPQYIYALGRYKRVLDQRNNLLREIKYGHGSTSGLQVWENQLALYGATVISRRIKFIEYLSSAAKKIYSMLTEESEELGTVYKPNVDIDTSASEEEIAAAFAQSLANRRELDISRGTTTTGPHRDDLILSVNGLPAREYASQGQQRTVAIALKLAEIDLMEESTGESPVVLLDDVMAELDEIRRARIIETTCNKCQTLITTTHLSELEDTLISNASIFEVKSGKVTKK